jgi:LysM repeat protein
MAEVLYPDGYASPPAMKTIDQVFARPSVVILHPEYKKRWKGLMIASGGKLGIGGGGRTTEQQERVFLDRHNKVGSGGCCMYKDQRYQLKMGYAHAAPPGLSFHETIVDGGAAAVDAIGDLKWAALNCQAYGLAQASWGNELWHFQFDEFPNSVSSWKRSGSPAPQNWTIPGGSPTPPTPPSGATYTVVSGDSWYGIAAKVGCTPEALVAANPPKTMQTVIHPGDVLNIPSSATKPLPPTPPPPQPATDWMKIGQDATTPPGTPNLKKGVVHSNVTWLQAVLYSMNCLAESAIDHDTMVQQFGDATAAGVKYWQGQNGIIDDGIYGPQTSAKMLAVRGK